jgi:hypothetical protein
MPTSKPRITITLTEEQHAILRRISAAGGQSMSSVISEFMLTAQPALERMAVALQRIKQERDADRQLVADMLSELHADCAHKKVSALSRASPHAPFEAMERKIPSETEPDSIQFCASVDFVRPDSDRATDFLADNDVGPAYDKQKRSTSPGTRDAVRTAEGALKRAKK